MRKITMIEHNPLVGLKERSSKQQGTIFCFPGAGDNVTSFISLANEMNNGLPLFGLQPRGLIAEENPYDSIKEMVDVYVQAIMKTGLKGPYYLLGHSFGGTVALEIFNRLTLLKCQLKPLILLDATPPELLHTHKTRLENLLDLVETLELVSKKPFNLSLIDLEPLSDDDQLILIHKKMIAAGLLPKQSNVDSISGMVRVFIANSHMEYWPSNKCSGEAALVNAMDARENRAERHEVFEQWRELIPSIKYYESAGNHITLLSKENIAGLVGIVEDVWGLTNA